jgi:hypothetical protein
MNRSLKITLIFVILGLVSVVTAFWAIINGPFSEIPPFVRRPPMFIPGDIELYYTVQTVVSTLNVALLIILLATYVNMYAKTKAEFTIGLIVFSAVMLLNSLFSAPFLRLGFGFSSYGLGPFAMLPDLFTFAALSVLLYLTLKY